MITGLHHVQLAMPPEVEDVARRFYVGVLQLGEAAKPASLAAVGGVWFRSGAAELHLGIEDPHTPARKAHPALLVDDLDALCARLEAAGVAYKSDARFPGYRRAYVHDPFGNRIELMHPSPPSP